MPILSLPRKRPYRPLAPRIGPRMAAVLDYVEHNPGRAMLHAARHVAPHGTGIAFGYRTVHRAIKAGIVRAVRATKGTATLLYPVGGAP